MMRPSLRANNDVPGYIINKYILGPGIYTLKSTFADVPKYLMNNAPSRYYE